MKKMMTLGLVLTVSSLSFAAHANQSSSFTTATGQTVKIGDPLHELISKTNQSPTSMKSSKWQEGQYSIPATSYNYDIGDITYTVTIARDKVIKIEWQKNLPASSQDESVHDSISE